MTVEQLNGWKEIAAYLDKSTRAAQRWERDLALPIRRMRTAKGGEIVYALKSEIEHWKVAAGSRRDEVAVEDALPPETDLWRGRGLLWLVATGVAVVIATATIALVAGRAVRTPPPPVAADAHPLPAAFTFTDAPGQLDPGPWPTQGHDAQRTNRSLEFNGPARPGPAQLIFDAHRPDGPSALAVLSNGNVLVGYCGLAAMFGPDGNERWRHALTLRGFSEEPAGFLVDASGRIHFGVGECPDSLDAVRLAVYTLLPDGSEYWHRQQPSVHLAPAIGPDATIYYMDEMNTIRAYRSDGTLEWTTDLPGFSQGAIAVDADGSLTVGTDGGVFNMTSLWRLGRTGRVEWTIETGSIGTPVLGPNGVAFVANTDSDVIAVDRTGRRLWATPVGGKLSVQPLALGARALYARTSEGIVALDLAGKIEWRFALATPDRTAPILDLDGNLYFPDDDAVISLGGDGRERWRLSLPHIVRLAIGGSRLLYATGVGRLYSVADTQ